MKRFLLFAWIILSMPIACSHFEEPVEPIAGDVQTRAVTGSNANNPYSLKNVRKAMNELSAVYGTQPTPIYATHEYVRFLVKDTIQFAILHDSLALMLFEYPLDRDLTEQEINTYNTPELDAEQWLYSVVPSNYLYPSEVEHEVLDELYMQNGNRIGVSAATRTVDDNNSGNPTIAKNLVGGSTPNTGQTAPLSESFWEEVIKRSMRNAGIDVSDKPSPTADWYPSVSISYNDNMSPVMGLPYVKVIVRDKTNIGYAYTDMNGVARNIKSTTGKWFTDEVQYSLEFKKDFGSPVWTVKDGLRNPATFTGPKQAADWVLAIDTNESRLSAFAATYKALINFFYNQNAITNNLTHLKHKLIIGVLWNEHHPEKLAHFTPAERRYGNDAKRNDIQLWGTYQNGAYYSRMDLTQGISHELGHASHWQTVINTKGSDRNLYYRHAEKKLKESYARAVEYYLTSLIYGKKTASNNMVYKGDYTGIGESLMNLGLSITDLQNSVKVCRKMWQWRDKTVELYGSKVDPEMIELIFNRPDSAWKESFSDMIQGPSATNQYQEESYTLHSYFEGRGVRVVGWSILDGDYSLTGGSLTQNTLRCKFLEPGTRTIKITVKIPFVSANQTYTKVVTVNSVEKTITALSESAISGSVTGGGKYALGEKCTLKAIPAAGRTFKGWYDGTRRISTANPYTFTVMADQMLTAKFSAATGNTCSVETSTSMHAETISGRIQFVAGGSVVPGSLGTTAGTRIEFKATPRALYTFSHWQDVDSGQTLSTANPYTMTITRDIRIMAVFKKSSLLPGN